MNVDPPSRSYTVRPCGITRVAAWPAPVDGRDVEEPERGVRGDNELRCEGRVYVDLSNKSYASRRAMRRPDACT